MGEPMGKQHCVVCAWREHCSKKFCVADGGARCPDFTRDVTIKSEPDEAPEKKGEGKI